MNPKWCQIETVLYYRFILPSSVKKAQKIIAVSEEVKKQIIKRYNIPEQKINVVYNGVSENFRRIKDIEELNNVRTLYNLPESFILFVGAIEPKKNLVRLVEAYKKIITQYNFDIKLVIAGKKGWKCKDFINKINEPELKDKIILTGYVKEEHLAAIYSLSDLFVFPSLYEGFGIPPLEAMACQTPVIVSNTGALPEITGGKCLQVNPYDVNEIAQGIHQLLTDFDFRTKTITEGYEWSKKFNWEKAAIETIKIYEKVLSENEEYHK